MTLKHSVMIIGVGSIGERHLRCFRATGRADVFFVEINDVLRKQISERYGIPGFADLDTALNYRPDADPNLQQTFRSTLAVVATPANLHIPVAQRLAEANFHLLIEKPLSTSLMGIDRLQHVMRERRLVVGVAYVYRSFPALNEMRNALLSGQFGKPLEIVAVCGQNFPTYRPAYRTTYYTDHATGGGAIQDALTHIINAGEWLVGPVDRLVTDAAHQVLEGVTVEDTVHVLARHGEVLGNYCLNQHQAPNEITLTVICERGTVRWESHQNRWRWMTRPDEPWHDQLNEPMPRDAAFIIQADRFLDAVENLTPPVCTLEEGLQTLNVNLAALASVDQRCWQMIGGHSGSPSIQGDRAQ